MNPPEIAHRLVELCRHGAYETAQRELYAADAVSVEPAHSPQPPAHGLEAIVAKGQAFLATMEVHGGSVSEPVVAGPFIALSMTLDLTPRGAGPAARFTMEEIAVYEVRDGKIIREQFFYEA